MASLAFSPVPPAHALRVLAVAACASAFYLWLCNVDVAGDEASLGVTAGAPAIAPRAVAGRWVEVARLGGADACTDGAQIDYRPLERDRLAFERRCTGPAGWALAQRGIAVGRGAHAYRDPDWPAALRQLFATVVPDAPARHSILATDAAGELVVVADESDGGIAVLARHREVSSQDIARLLRSIAAAMGDQAPEALTHRAEPLV